MKPIKLFSLLIVVSILGLGFLNKQNRKEAPSEQFVSDILFSLGETKPDHYIENMSPEMVEKGRELIFNGRTTNPKGKRSIFISKFFKCTSCHNTVKEEMELSEVNPEARLSYAETFNIPYLQGSTFYGMVNRETWYNDDYVKKYGDLVKPAKNSLKESIQLCAQECSQGRYVEEWEMNAMLAYLWSISLKESDLRDPSIFQSSNLSPEERIKKIKSKYLLKSPATFGELPPSKKEGYPGIKGDPKNGEIIYRRSCQHCHREQGESDVVLDESEATLNWLKRNITSNSQLSIYEILRKGTYAESGHKEYMPLYTEEKLTNQQVEDLRAFIELER